MVAPVESQLLVARGIADDAALVRAAGAGSVPAQELLWRTHLDAVYRLCASQLAPHDAEDAAADTFLAAFAAWATFDPERGSLRKWLQLLAMNQVRLRWRRERRFGATLERLRGSRSRSIDQDALADGVIARADARAVRAALEQLSPGDRHVLVTQVVGDLGPDELAAVLDCAPGAAKVRLHRARVRLAKVLDQSTRRGGGTRNA